MKNICKTLEDLCKIGKSVKKFFSAALRLQGVHGSEFNTLTSDFQISVFYTFIFSASISTNKFSRQISA